MKKEVSDAQRRAVKKYDATHTKYYGLKLNTKTDADIIEVLSQQDNVQAYIKKTIRNAIAAETNKEV